LQDTIARYNRNEATADGASVRGTRPTLESGPWVALGPVRHYITFSDSGVAVDERHRVLGADQQAIEGLYAVGFIGMGGMLLEGLGHHLGWAFTSGRRAGRFAASRVVTEDLRT
jgi:predicted oxidoreductase